MPNDAERVRALTRATEAQTTAMKLLTGRVEEFHRTLEAQTKATRRKTWAFVGVLVFDLLLTVGVGWVVYDQYDTRERVLCPLYSVFVRSYNPDGPAARSAGIQAYNAQFADIRNQYRALGCNFVEPFVWDPATSRLVPRPPDSGDPGSPP